MPENNPQTEPVSINPAALREKILVIAEVFVPKIPQMIEESIQTAPMAVKMFLPMLRPYLPQLETLLLNKIEDANDEQILSMVRMVQGVNRWLQEDSSSSGPAIESQPSE